MQQNRTAKDDTPETVKQTKYHVYPKISLFTNPFTIRQYIIDAVLTPFTYANTGNPITKLHKASSS
jgi:hypothetical protein